MSNDSRQADMAEKAHREDPKKDARDKTSDHTSQEEQAESIRNLSPVSTAQPDPPAAKNEGANPLGRTTSRTSSLIQRIRSTRPELNFTHPLSHEKTKPDTIVEFDGPDDPYHPLNWPERKKFITLFLYAITALGTAFNSAIFASATNQISGDFGVSIVVASLATSLTLVGFAFGPLFWGPLSEVFGRKWVVLGPYFISAMFAFGCGASANFQTILITRFFQGIFSGSVITNTGGLLGDIYAPKDRGLALIVYTLCVVGGPLLSPLVGSAIVSSYLRWRWIMYIVGILQTFTSILGMLTVDESYPPVLLAYKAKRLRLETGNWALHAKHEEFELSLDIIAKKYLVRPFKLLANPICFLMSFYASFVYGLIYGSLAAIPIIFEEHRGWTPVQGSLPFLALLLGAVFGLGASSLNQKPYVRAINANGGKPVPEARLFPMMFGGTFLSAGLFILAWTGTLSVIWVVPCIGILFIGIGFFPIFQSSTNYIIDAFLPVAASAVATVTFMRSLFAAVFSIFMEPMLNALGIGWGLSLLGFVSVALLPVPFLFYAFGKQLRAHGAKSKFFEGLL